MFLASVLLFAKHTAAQSCGCSTYTVVSGDSIYGTIAPATGHNWLDICNCHGGLPSCGTLTVGEVLQLPCAAGENAPVSDPTPSPTPQPTAPTHAPTPMPTPNPTAKPTQRPTAPTPSPTPNPTVTGNPNEIPNLSGPIKTSLWTDQTSNVDGTYYGNWEDNKAMTRDKVQAVGACGISGVGTLPAFDSDVMPIAISALNYDSGLACGMCIEYIGTGTGLGADPIGTSSWQKAIVVDKCPGCAAGDIDLAENGDGRWQVNWRAVDCSVGSDKFEYTFYTGNHDWWVKVQVRNHKVPIYKMELLDQAPAVANGKTYSGNYVEMIRSEDNHFVADSDNMTRPYSHKMKFRLTSIFGEVVEEEIDTVNNANLGILDYNNPVTGTVQFEGGSYGAAGSRRLVQTATRDMQHRIGELFAGL